MASQDRVLALSMRPKCLDELVGQDELIGTLTSQFASNRIPHFYIISGPIGAGKTTLSRILALILQTQVKCESIKDLHNLPWNDYKKYDIHEINAANKNGIDDIRSIVEMMKYTPMAPSKAKVVILDEAHQLTNAAQNALLTETEDVAKHVFYIFCTSAISKIIPALQRRAYIVSPKPLDSEAIGELIQKAKERVEFEGEVEPLVEALKMHDICSPGLILQAAERYFSGIPAHESVLASVENSKIDTMALCRAVAKGDWKACAGQLKDATKTDVTTLRSCVLGYLKTVLLKSIGSKASGVARAMQTIATHQMDDTVCLPSFMASVCLACERIGA